MPMGLTVRRLAELRGGKLGCDNRAYPALSACWKTRRHRWSLGVIGDPIVGDGSSSTEKRVGSCVARPKACFCFLGNHLI
ncbi:hypothetical protein B0H65DRAFT_451511 [Neurospora tetraspora]|uniref:Uncharacterized protein n=1 Tax=Neurospora tetraspora TaxID=94610 RepID=A0AAE0JPI8_9PEZI|nr:hypothetical protein B0H65DRAFT_451511 [Neurospora tetraspora]